MNVVGANDFQELEVIKSNTQLGIKTNYKVVLIELANNDKKLVVAVEILWYVLFLYSIDRSVGFIN